MSETSLKDRASNYFGKLQKEIVAGLEVFEPRIHFQSHLWERPGGGGGESRILSGGKIFEKAGVNLSLVHGDLPSAIQQKLNCKSAEFFATGISLVLHPFSPKIPTVHANFRYFEQPDRAWFGGGVDLTPYVYAEEDFMHFHGVLKEACNTYRSGVYAKFKKECDTYFFIPHRNETRGVGGIFFDYQSEDLEGFFKFVQKCGNSFLKAYAPIVERNKDLSFSEREKKFQLLRRGRYVEFNLIYDRGTLFGLQTRGNIESILMSLPPVVHYDWSPDMEVTPSEKKLMESFRTPRDWI